eukprot:TRINITY_DN2266_c0_g1_i1.p1 TRINITY_DN2266_c0_g1~~TRINITY_DN2266_c0_g1_i1.p1  ORF type:complete len:250 (-),score=45.92 TRINITY_DN2266_c0_g1_i1:122-871(-)
MVPGAVDFSEIKPERISMTQFIDLEEMDDLEAPLAPEDPVNYRAQIAPKPFAKGSLRLAYSATVTESDHKSDVVILKEYYHKEYRWQDRVRTFHEMEVGTIAQFLAKQFASKCRELVGKPIEFNTIRMIQFPIREGNDCYMMEPYLDAKFERFSNNAEYLNPAPEFEIFQTFTHWTYIATNKKMMIVDLEGAVFVNKYVLTDPAIHAVDKLRFGKTNLGAKGMETFLKVHKCGNLCQSVIPAKDWVNIA